MSKYLPSSHFLYAILLSLSVQQEWIKWWRSTKESFRTGGRAENKYCRKVWMILNVQFQGECQILNACLCADMVEKECLKMCFYINRSAVLEKLPISSFLSNYSFYPLSNLKFVLSWTVKCISFLLSREYC